MTTITIDRAVVEEALDYIVTTNKSSQFWLVPHSNLNKTVSALRAALTQQALNAAEECEHKADGWYAVQRAAGVTRVWPMTEAQALRSALAQQDEPQGCATEEDCTKQPWCRIRGECQRKQAEPKPMPPEQRQRWEELAAMPQQAEPLQEPVAEVFVRRDKVSFAFWLKAPPPDRTKLYTAPPQRKPLTEEEIDHVANSIITDDPVQWWRKLARAVERAHGIKE